MATLARLALVAVLIVVGAMIAPASIEAWMLAGAAIYGVWWETGRLTRRPRGAGSKF